MDALLKRFIEGNHFKKRTAYKRRAKQEMGGRSCQGCSQDSAEGHMFGQGRWRLRGMEQAEKVSLVGIGEVFH